GSTFPRPCVNGPALCQDIKTSRGRRNALPPVIRTILYGPSSAVTAQRRRQPVFFGAEKRQVSHATSAALPIGEPNQDGVCQVERPCATAPRFAIGPVQHLVGLRRRPTLRSWQSPLRLFRGS